MKASTTHARVAARRWRIIFQVKSEKNHIDNDTIICKYNLQRLFIGSVTSVVSCGPDHYIIL